MILGWEESIGYMPGATLDKDGVSVAAMFAEMAADLWESGRKRFSDQLSALFKQYGYHVTRNSYWIVPEKAVTRRLFEDTSNNPPASIGGHKVVEVRDLTVFNSTKGAVSGHNFFVWFCHEDVIYDSSLSLLYDIKLTSC